MAAVSILVLSFSFIVPAHNFASSSRYFAIESKIDCFKCAFLPEKANGKSIKANVVEEKGIFREAKHKMGKFKAQKKLLLLVSYNDNASN